MEVVNIVYDMELIEEVLLLPTEQKIILLALLKSLSPSVTVED